MSTVDELIVRAARLLNDYDENTADGDYKHVRWPKSYLLDYLNEGLAQLSAHRPDAFTQQRRAQLKPGVVQTVPDDAVELVRVNANIENGQVGEAVHEHDRRFVSAVRGKRCLTTTGCSAPGAAAYKVSSWAKDPINDRQFEVYPPVPPRTSAEVSMTVIARPRKFCRADYADEVGVRPEFEAALIAWMLYRAYSMDTESVSSLEAAQRHEKSFYTILNAQKKNRSEFNADVRANLTVPASPAIRYRPREDRPS